MSTTMLDIPDIIQEIIRRNIQAAVDVVENIYEAAIKAPIIAVKGEDAEVEPQGKGLSYFQTPIIVGCWEKTDEDADNLRNKVVDVFKTTANYINPEDKDGSPYGIKVIEIKGFDSDDTRTLRGNRYVRILELNVHWYLVY